jgi:hypothetical protein
MSNLSANEIRPSATPQSRPSANWGVPVALTVIAAGFSVLNPALIIFVPLAFMLVALPPRKPWLVMIALVLLASTFVGPSGGEVLWWFGRGWALILSAWFVLAIALLPGSGVLARALAAVGGSAATVALLFLAIRNGWHQLDWTVGMQLRTGASDIVAFWGSRVPEKPWTSELASAIYSFTDFQANTYPALLGIASLAGLALAWWLWRRLSIQDPRPLGPLRDFRFRDELIWVVVIGAVLMVLPLENAASRAGANLLTFMAALYAVRGLAVMLALFGSPSLFGALFGALLLVMLPPIVMAATLMVGLTDTWLDLRARRLRQDNEKH